MDTRQPRPVVVGIDESFGRQRALSWAATQAQLLDAPLRIVHALNEYPALQPGVPGLVPLPQPPPGAQSRAELQCRYALVQVEASHPRLTVSADVVTGDPAQELIQCSSSARLVVVGARGLGAIKGLVMGSVSARLLLHAQSPVVVVHESASTTLPDLRIVLGVDGRADCAAAVRFAFEEADRRGAGLTVVHTWDLDDSAAAASLTWSVDWAQAGEQERLALAESIAGYRAEFPWVDVRCHVVRAHPVDELARQSENAALLVVGSRGRHRLAGLMLGSVSQRIITRAHCPVAVVPQVRRGAGPPVEHHLPVPPVRERL